MPTVRAARPTENPKTLFTTLEAMRGLAALLIVDRHVGWLGAYDFPISGLAVDLFFLLSGAVLAHSYEHKLRAGELTTGRFVALRLIRLYPLYALFTLVGFVHYAATSGLTSADVLKLASSLLFSPCTWIDGSVFPFDGPAWSIFFELVISVIFGVALYDKSIKFLAGVAAAAAGLFVVQAIAQPGAVDFAMTCQSVFETGLARVVFSFTTGVILYRLASRAGVFRAPWLSVVALAVACAMLMLPFENRVVVNALIAALVLAGLPVCVFLAIVFPAPQFLHGAFRRLGEISFPVYVGHVPLYNAADALLKRQFHIDAMAWAPWSGVIFVIALLALAHVLHHAFDAPLRARLRQWVLKSPTLALPPREAKAQIPGGVENMRQKDAVATAP